MLPWAPDLELLYTIQPLIRTIFPFRLANKTFSYTWKYWCYSYKNDFQINFEQKVVLNKQEREK